MLGVAGLLGSGRTELARALTRHRPAGCRRSSAIQGKRVEPAQPAHGDLARRRLLVGEPPHRGHHQRAERAGEHHARPAGPARHPAPHPPAAPARARARAGSRRSTSARADPDRPRGHPVGRQPAEGAARPPARARRRACCVLDEPTRGIDVGAKVEVQNLVGELADNGLSVMFISAELEEVLRVGNRVAIVLRRHGSSTRCRPTSSTADSLTGAGGPAR